MKENYLKEEDYATCMDCGCLIEKRYSAKVKDYGVDVFYCKEHKKQYTRQVSTDDGFNYYGEVRMEKDGTPVGYKLINKLTIKK